MTMHEIRVSINNVLLTYDKNSDINHHYIMTYFCLLSLNTVSGVK